MIMGVLLSKVNVVNKIRKRRMELSDSPFFHFLAKDENMNRYDTWNFVS